MPFGGFCPLPIRLGGDAETGWPAAGQARASSDMVALKLTAPLAILTFTQVTTAATIDHCQALWGIGASFNPTFSYGGGAGMSVWTFAKLHQDSYEIEDPVTIRHAIVGVHHVGTCRHATARIILPNRVDVDLFDIAGAGCDGKVSLWLW